MRYFAEVETLGELKKEFRRLALVNHPDHGGDACIMRDIICEYQRLVRILPEIVEPGEPPCDSEFVPGGYVAHYATTAGGANPHLARLATPVYSHRDMCLAAKTLYLYSGTRNTMPLPEFFRRLCDELDPGQWLPYRDYKLFIDRKTAQKQLQFLVRRVLSRIFRPKIWGMVKAASERLAT